MESTTDITRQAALLAWRYGRLEGEALLQPLLQRELRGRVALLSSFGSESALLLDMVARIDRTTPVIFLDTGKLFAETLRYRDQLVERLRLGDVRSIAPDPATLAARDPAGDLHRRDADGCCRLRKVEPLSPALIGLAALISGRKRYQGGARQKLPAIEPDGRLIRINPLVAYSVERIEHERAARGLPPHPLEAEGFLSIGCAPCTDPVRSGEDRRAGRWRGSEKRECGIHHPFQAVDSAA
ncbi:MAG TPA: phosphoadenylyl-sulfate reductase [Stellaceae bacterium]|nr:phosphoadenylyl-sulfate reductase [Stellaceae bacterium]